MSCGFCGMMRGAELGVPDGVPFDSVQHLTLADVTFGSDATCDFVRLMMRPVKDARFLRGKTYALVLAGGGALVDPVAEMRAHALRAGSGVDPADYDVTPLFATHGRAVCVGDVRRMVKALMASVGADPCRYGAHSLRIGGATAALAAGVEPAVIRVCGRWSSACAEIYMRLTRQAAARFSTMIGSTPFDDIERECFADEELGIS